MTTDSKHCPQCGTPMPTNAPAGLCPRCVMAMNMATETDFTDEVGPHGTRVLKQPPTPDDLRDKFPQLEILELLGRGGMGAVYKARQKELDRIVALKILPPGIGEDPAFAERFSREAKALAKLNHPNIVTLYEFGRADGLFFFLMEFVDGVNLRQLLDTGRVASREALAIVPQICDALQYAHDNGIVHRDIKPENILMDRRGRVKVADFGLAKLVGATNDTLPGGIAVPKASSLTDAGKIMGTPQYMAPEQKDKPLEVDHRADIYALGVVFYQMLTGELPGKSLEAPSKKVQIDVRLDEIVLRALERKPELRFQSAEELKTRVETMGTEPVQAAPPTETRRWSMLTACLFFAGAAYMFAGIASELISNSSKNLSSTFLWILGGFGALTLGWNALKRVSSKSDNGMPKMLLITFGALAVSIIANLIMLPYAGVLNVLDIGFKGLLLVGLARRSRAAYLLTIVAAFFAGALAFKVPFPFNLVVAVVTLAIVFPLLGSTLWFFPLTLSRPRRRVWLGATVILALAGFFVMLAAPAPTRFFGNDSTANAQQLNTPQPSAEMVFGPAIERVLEDPDNGDGRSNKETLVMQTGELINAVDDAPKEQGGRLRALLASEGDLFAEYDDYVTKRWAFTAAELRLSDFPTSQWETAAPYQVEESLFNPTAVEQVEHSGATLYLLPDGLVPMTFAFSAKDGSRGLMQITGFDDNPRAIRIRYKLVQAAPTNPGNTSIALQDAQRAWKNAGTFFGPVIERLVQDSKAQGPDSLIDLDTGRLITPPAPKEADWEWMQKSGADALSDTTDSVRGLIGTGGMVIVPVTSDSWKGMTPLEVRKIMVPLVSNEIESTAMSGAGNVPATFLFKTRSQNIGILQITGFSESPNAVKIRYKLLQKANTAVAKPGEYKITLTNGITVEVVAVTRDPLKNDTWWKPDGTKLAKPPGNHVVFTPNNYAEGKDIGTNDHAIFLQYSWNKGTSLSSHEDEFGHGGQFLGFLQIQDGDSVDLAIEGAKRVGRMITGGAGGPKPSRKNIGTAKVVRFPVGTQEATAIFTTAAGPWEQVAVYDGTRTKVSVDGVQVLCTSVPPNPRHEGGPVLTVTHDLDLERYALRMFAVLKNGKREQTHFYHSKLPSRETQSSVQLGGFEKDLSQVKEYILERTPWVHGEIRGIALNAGQKLSATQESHHKQEPSAETKSYVLPHRAQMGQKVLDTSRDFATEHGWKVQRESGGTTNGVTTVTIEVTDLSGKRVSFTEADQGDGTARLIIRVEAGSEFSVERIGTALARRLKLAEGFVTTPDGLNTSNEKPVIPPTKPAGGSSKWQAQIQAMNSMDWRKALDTADKVASLPPAEGLAVVRANWTSVTNAESRKQFLKAFTFANHRHLIPVLELGYLDPAPPVQEWGMSYLKGIALRDFSEHYAAGKEWLAQHREMPLSDVMHESVKAAARRLRETDPKMVETQLKLIQFSGEYRDQPKALAGSGMEEALEPIINGNNPKLAESAVRASGELALSSSWYERVILPKIKPGNPLEVRSNAATALQLRGGEWAAPALLEALTNLLTSTSSTDRLLFSQFSGALAEIGSPKVIPTMIAVIEAHNGYDTVYGVGYFGLGKLTGVDYDASHDGAWWRQWWEKNKERFPADVQAMPIPKLAPAKSVNKRQSSGSDSSAASERFAGGDTDKVYYLVGDTNKAAMPKEGFRLVLALPGGDGGRDFHPFIKNCHKNGSPPGYLLAQLVAPQWDKAQPEKLVWPTENNPYPGMKFSTEQFIHAVISELEKQHKLDTRHIFTWSWSSGGPAAYAISLQPKTKVTGSFVAMSVFKPDQLSDLSAAKGHSYYILHSPEDFIPMRMAEQARDLLQSNGARTKLQTYEGGHGWHGDIFGNIRDGLEWLEEKTAKPFNQ